MSYYIAMDRYGNYDLAHHGILGQKWGVRRYQNKDGSLTNAGKERYSVSERQKEAIKQTIKTTPWTEDYSKKVFSIAGADTTALDKAHDILKSNVAIQREVTAKEREMFLELKTNKETRNYYEAVSEIASYGDWKPADDWTLSDIADCAYMGIFEDGQQSSVNAYSMYAYKHRLSDSAFKLYDKAVTSDMNARKAASDVVESALKQVGADTITVSENNPNYTISKRIVGTIIVNNYDNWKDTAGLTYLDMAANSVKFGTAEKVNIQKAEKIASKLKNNHDENTWYLLREATDNLGLSNEKASSLSSSDWDRINAEIRSLRAKGGGF